MAQRLAIAAIIAIVTWAVFSPALGGEILFWDDDINLVSNAALKHIDARSLHWMFTDTAHVLRYKPLNWLLWASLIQAFGIDEAPYHAVNLALHAANAALVFLVLETVLARWTGTGTVRVRLVAAVSAACWALHPMRIEAVAWISGVGYPLALFFGLLSLWVMAIASTGATRRVRYTWISLSALLWLLALSSYPSALCLVPAFPLVAYAAAPLEVRGTKLMASAIPHLALAAGLAGFTVVMRVVNPGHWLAAGLASVGLREQVARLFLFWFWAAARQLPFATISPIHDAAMHPALLSAPVIAACASILLGTFLLALWARRWKPPILMWTAFLVALVPHAGLTEPVFLPAERYLYVASLYVIALFALGLASNRTWRSWTVGIAVASLGMAFWTRTHANLWHSNVAFFSRGKELAATSLYRGFFSGRLGLVRAAQGEYADAIGLLEMGVREQPQNWPFRFRLAEALETTNQIQRSADEYGQLYARDTNNALVANRLASVLVRLGRTDEAIAILRKIFAAQPTPANQINLARALTAGGEEQEALALLSADLRAKSPAADVQAHGLGADTAPAP